MKNRAHGICLLPNNFAKKMSKIGIGLLLVAPFGSAYAQSGSPKAAERNAISQAREACEKAGPQGCLAMSLEAMGGRERLEAVRSFSYEAVGHTELVEQSYRQDPFITSYERSKGKVDLAGGRIHLETRITWPESDPGQADADATLIVGPDGGVQRVEGGDAPCSLADLAWARDALALGPMRLLLTAQGAADLHFESPIVIRATPHIVLAFTAQGVGVRILINPFNHLPDAVETLQRFDDHWFQWGDVRQRIYLDNFQNFHGIIFPTNQVEERNGILWRSSQVLKLELNINLDEADFKMAAKAAQLSRQSPGWDRPFNATKSTELAPDVVMFPGAWNSTLVKQDDGIIVLEAPISGNYTGGVIDEAKVRYPSLPIKAVLSTSDSWPHVGGVRQAVASGLRVYILDLNQPLLERLVSAPHKLHPDLLEQSPKEPDWRIVSGKLVLGSGPNRVELYPLRGASTERQYMAYFPEHKLLYASDTLSLNDDGSLYDPELMREVMEAVKREGLQVRAVFAMHQGPTPWSQVLALVEKSLS